MDTKRMTKLAGLLKEEDEKDARFNQLIDMTMDLSSGAQSDLERLAKLLEDTTIGKKLSDVVHEFYVAGETVKLIGTYGDDVVVEIGDIVIMRMARVGAVRVMVDMKTKGSRYKFVIPTKQTDGSITLLQ